MKKVAYVIQPMSDWSLSNIGMWYRANFFHTLPPTGLLDIPGKTCIPFQFLMLGSTSFGKRPPIYFLLAAPRKDVIHHYFNYNLYVNVRAESIHGLDFIYFFYVVMASSKGMGSE